MVTSLGETLSYFFLFFLIIWQVGKDFMKSVTSASILSQYYSVAAIVLYILSLLGWYKQWSLWYDLSSYSCTRLLWSVYTLLIWSNRMFLNSLKVSTILNNSCSVVVWFLSALLSFLEYSASGFSFWLMNTTSCLSLVSMCIPNGASNFGLFRIKL